MGGLEVMAEVPVAELFVDPSYQRTLDEKRVDRIASEFDPALLGALEVSARNGRSAVFDGQHRLAALRKIGRRSAPCIVHRDLSVADEARLFVRLQTERKPLPPMDRFRARIVAGEEQAIAVERIAKAAGYSVSDNGAIGSIGAVTALDRTFALDKTGEVLAGALDLLSIWRGEPKATDGALIQGLGLFVRDHGQNPKVMDGSVIAKFEEVPARVILRRAIAQTTNGGGSNTRPVAVLKELRKLAGVRAPRKTPRKAAKA